ncbi:MAG: hypothetical protein B7733_16665, partial [Myxococcales bacterium FL481]
MVELSKSRAQPLTLPADVSEPSTSPERLAAGAIAAVVAAAETDARLRAVDPSRVEHLFLVGAAHPNLLAALLEAFPGVSCVVFVDSPAQLRRFRESSSAGAWRSVDGLTIDYAGEPDDAQLLVAAGAVLAERPAPLRQSLVVADPERLADVPCLGRAVGRLRDLVEPLGTAGIDEVLTNGEALRCAESRAALLRFVERLGTCGDTFYALRLLSAASGSSPSMVRPSQLAAYWSQLGEFSRAKGFLEQMESDGVSLGAAKDELSALQVHDRRQRDELVRHNLVHLAEHFPELVTPLEQVDAAAIEVARVENSPWIYDRATDRSYLAEYPLLFEEVDHRLVPKNAPSAPDRFRDFLMGLRDPRSAHACVGTVAALSSIVALTRNRVSTALVDWRQLIYLCEPDLSLFRRLIELFDLSPYLRNDQIKLFAGRSAYKQFCLSFAENPFRIIPDFRAHVPAPVQGALERVDANRRELAQRALLKLKRDYSPDRHARLLAKLDAGEPLRVWGLTSRHTAVLQYVVADLLEGFRALGHQTELAMEADHGERVSTCATLTSLARFEPDVVLLADHVRPELQDALPQHIPCLVWVLDEMPELVNPEVIAGLGLHDLTFPISQEWTERYLELGYPHAACLPFAANPRRCEVNEEIEPANEVAFATHVVRPKEFSWAPGFLERLTRRLEQGRYPAWDLDAQRELIEETIDDLGLDFTAAQRERLHFQGFLLSRDRDRVA